MHDPNAEFYRVIFQSRIYAEYMQNICRIHAAYDEPADMRQSLFVSLFPLFPHLPYSYDIPTYLRQVVHIPRTSTFVIRNTASFILLLPSPHLHEHPDAASHNVLAV